jgi:hypothetical protein
MFARRGGTQRPAVQWSRQKMLALLVGAGVCAVVLVAGLVLAVAYAVHPARHTAEHSTHNTPGGESAPPGRSVQGSDPRDALASKPMRSVDDAASHPAPVSIRDPGTAITLPAPTTTGAVQVPTGFPHTPEGAMAQLAAIDQVALQSGSLAGGREVITHWAEPGGPTRSSWSVVQALSILFDEAGLSGGGSSQLALVLTPLMGQIKGSVGPDFVIPCVDFELDVTLDQTARGATADCQRMAWSGGRWMIGPGSEPATPPSVWPDTDLSIEVGYHDVRQEPQHA